MDVEAIEDVSEIYDFEDEANGSTHIPMSASWNGRTVELMTQRTHQLESITQFHIKALEQIQRDYLENKGQYK